MKSISVRGCRWLIGVGVAVLLSVVTACSSPTSSTEPPSAGAPSSGVGPGAGGAGTMGAVPGPRCPVAPLSIVVSVDQWADVVRQLAGQCGQVTTIVGGTSGDPHDYEPTPGDNAKFTHAKLVVINGAGYDPWADKAVETLSARPAVVNGADVVGVRPGDNPHLWYSPEYVSRVSDAVTTRLKQLSPDAGGYFDGRAQDFQTALVPYRDALVAVKAKGTGRRYAATEAVFDYLAQAAGLTNATPAGYARATANGSEPAPGDVNEFQNVLKTRSVDVLIFNAQTEGAIPDHLRTAADAAGVPIVDVTETIAPGQPGFVSWQVEQLQRLARALG